MVNRFEWFVSSISCISRYIQKIERDEMIRYGLKGRHAQYSDCHEPLSGRRYRHTALQHL